MLERHARATQNTSTFVALHFAARALALRRQEQIPLDAGWFTAVWPVYQPVFGVSSVTDLIPELDRLNVAAYQADNHREIDRYAGQRRFVSDYTASQAP